MPNKRILLGEQVKCIWRVPRAFSSIVNSYVNILEMIFENK